MLRPTVLLSLALAATGLSASAPVAAQEAPATQAAASQASWEPRSGDVWVDTWLGDINRYGARYQQAFIDEVVRYHDAPRALVRELVLEKHWMAGDVYYACAVANVLGRPCRYVADAGNRRGREGWEAVTRELGLEPGSPEFHRLKRGFVSSYEHWGRPIVIDESLYGEFPARVKAAKAANAKAAAQALQEAEDQSALDVESPADGDVRRQGTKADDGRKPADRAGDAGG